MILRRLLFLALVTSATLVQAAPITIIFRSNQVGRFSLSGTVAGRTVQQYEESSDTTTGNVSVTLNDLFAPTTVSIASSRIASANSVPFDYGSYATPIRYLDTDYRINLGVWGGGSISSPSVAVSRGTGAGVFSFPSTSVRLVTDNLRLDYGPPDVQNPPVNYPPRGSIIEPGYTTTNTGAAATLRYFPDRVELNIPVAFPFNNVELYDGFLTANLVISGQITLAGTVAPVITAQPKPRFLREDASASFTVEAIAIPEPTYQWLKNGTAISGANAASYSVSPARQLDAAGYSVRVTNSVGSVTSEVAQLSVLAVRPSALTLAEGQVLDLFAEVYGTPATSFRWLKTGVAFTASGSTSTLTIPSVPAGAGGIYTVEAVHRDGTAVSKEVPVTIVPAGTPGNTGGSPGGNTGGSPGSGSTGSGTGSTGTTGGAVGGTTGTGGTTATTNPGRLVNLSILTGVSSAGDSFTMGYVVGGAGTSGSKPILIRAAGPSLQQLGVTGFLADPKFDTFAGSAQTGDNDNWGGTAALTTAFSAVGAFAYSSSGSLDAAVLATLSAGDNSVKVSGNGAGTGTVIAELYDSTPNNSFTAATPRLINVSVLKHLGTGLTLGFVIGGSTGKTVLIRAVGPTIGAPPFNVGGAIADPQFTLFSGQTGIGANDNWGGTAALTAAFSQVGAFGLPPASRDAALVTTLQPGSYTVQVNGVNSTTGVAIVEVYEVP
jgi:hypothetical protein